MNFLFFKEVAGTTLLPENVNLEMEFKPVPVFKGFRNSIRLAIGQVFENAIAAVQDNGGGHIRIELGTADNMSVLAIRDDGVGMKPATLKRAIDPFYTTKAPGPHIGMGLSTAHAVMSKHKGTLEIESSPRQGTSVMMRFPLPGDCRLIAEKQ